MTANLLVRAVIAVTLAVLVGPSNIWAGNASKEIPMKGTFRDLTTDGIRSDGHSPSSTYSNGTDSVRAVLVPAGNFVLDTRNSPSRNFILDFGSGSDCTTALGKQHQVVEVEFFSTAQLIDNNGNLVDGRLLGMPVRATYRSDAQVFFAIGDTQYFVRFDPSNDGGHNSAYVLITRKSDTSWVIQTGVSQTSSASSTASLLSQPLNGKPVITWVADCSMPFELDVACQKIGCAP